MGKGIPVKDYQDLTFYKYRALNEEKYTEDIIQMSRLFLSPWEDLNDPQEGLIRYKIGHKIKYSGTIRHLKEKYPSEVPISATEARICSLSANWSNPVLWALYADGGKGICLGMRILNLEIDQKLIDVKYDQECCEFMQPIGVHQLEKALSRKSRHWEFEEERRVLSVNSNQIYLEAVEVKEIIFGERTPVLEKARIIRMGQKLKNVKFFNVEHDVNKYGLTLSCLSDGQIEMILQNET